MDLIQILISMGYTLFWFVVLLGVASPILIVYAIGRQRRAKREAAEAAGVALDEDREQVSRVERPRPRPQAREEEVRDLAEHHPRAATPEPIAPPARPAWPHPLTMTLKERKNLIIVGGSGDGKTQCQLAFVVRDIAEGAQVAWVSTNGSLYNDEDQTTDLRPLEHHFEFFWRIDEAAALIRWAFKEIERRRELYRVNQPVGHPIVIHFDEWPELADKLPADVLAEDYGLVLEQGRKVRVFVGEATHNVLVDNAGHNSGTRALFQTRLVANTDQTSWTAMMGRGVPQRRVEQGQGRWHIQRPDGEAELVQITRPSARTIAQIAAHPPRRFPFTLREAIAGELEELEEARAPKPAKGAGKAPGITITDDHHRVRDLVLAARPRIAELVAQGKDLEKARELTETSNRAIGYKLYQRKGGGAAMKAGEILAEVEKVFGVRLFDDAPNSAFSASAERENAERVTA